ncbi:FecR family protein [Dyadobacter fermentans]|uniref:Anti-FecI sigma factor, FecR n=1 Tax=Dyadobacter fermentans (strain ATCC 700827 / DSM 18053 / CIP 107007 / KCTC 52180 / NS114) TaxID=471854 RepID=C6VRK4_DYAFD|nr:FecR family protein [Dyadobacter fermentans]ACT92707.1 anti-FecI sigma factor, FecR [Dyadobacter fermentans DSM 18053]
MSYYHYGLADFLEDRHFKSWVLTPDRESDDFWNNFLLQHPEKSEAIAGARSLLLGIQSQMEEDFPADDQVASMLEGIQSRRETTGGGQARRLWFRLGASLTAAAVVLVVIGWLRKPNRHDNHVSYSELLSAVEEPLIEQTNTTIAPILLTLPDSSTILLQPKSSVSYRRAFMDNALREVYLSGHAFFTVTKNRQRPFVVYSNELVTKVLGTSFMVKAFEDAKQVEVCVKTGKVSVFPRTDTEVCEGIATPELAGTIITPNQKVLFSRDQIQIRKELVESPEVLVSAVLPAPLQKFQDMPVAQLFSNIEETYGIDIVYDDRLFSQCLLTASFTNESLYEKMDLICKGIEADFQIVDGRMIISGHGCN